MSKKRLKGIVVSDKMDKTIVVKVEILKTHRLYRRKYKSHTKYKAHDEMNAFKTGDVVVIEETRPLSKDKTWRVISENQKAETQNLKT
ncbi:30S ribosomal protein S17 [Patescibacteria group bacterium]|nr:30S ribosomal protein S17 [Patescibacteria group bacterium]MBU4162458.1 30S ribosomal protein S17 [Patescibacteria group bacterium]